MKMSEDDLKEIEKFRSVKPDELNRSNDFGNKIVNFEEIVLLFEEIKKFILRFVNEDNSINQNVSESIQRQIISLIKSMNREKDKIDNLSKENISTAGSEVINSLNHLRAQSFDQLNPHLFAVTGEINQLINEARDAEKNVKIISGLTSSAGDYIEKLERFVQQGDESASKAASKELSREFDKAAADANKASLGWLFSSIGFGFLIMLAIFGIRPFNVSGFADFILFQKEFHLPNSAIIRLLAIALFSTGLQFSISNHKTSKHLREVNHFRARILNVFERIIEYKGMKDDVRLEFLRGASTAIFSLTETGYAGSKDKIGTGLSINFPTKIV